MYTAYGRIPGTGMSCHTSSGTDAPTCDERHATIGALAPSPWLFPGGQPGRPISTGQLTRPAEQTRPTAYAADVSRRASDQEHR